MIAIIKCFDCEEIIGSLEKELITQEDVELYKAMTKCSSNHSPDLIQEEE